jgi:multidrug resistance efflux pump
VRKSGGCGINDISEQYCFKNSNVPAMTRVLALPVALIPTVMLTLAEDQSRRNKSEEPNSFCVKSPIPNLNLSNDRSAPDAPGDAIARLEKKLEEAKEDAKGAERLCKNGVLSKVEMEQRVLKVMECEAELARARLAEAKGKVAELESGVASGESAKDQVATAKAALKQLSEATEAAMAKRERAELETAEANLHRQQELLKLGIVGKSDVDRAEEKLSELTAQKH